jgi:hypothetical protein
MVRLSLGLAALVLCTAASPATTFVIARTPGADAVSRLASSAPLPHGYTAAPMPNPDANAPVFLDSARQQPTLAPSLFNPKATYRGEGFVAGSTVQGAENSKVKPAVGGTMSVPLQ